MISHIIALDEGFFFLYSTFSTNVSTAYRLTSNDIRVLSKIKHKERYILASRTATKKSAIIQNKLNTPFGWLIEPLAEKALTKNLIRKPMQKDFPVISDKVSDKFR